MKPITRLTMMLVLLELINISIKAQWVTVAQFKGTAPGDIILLQLKKGENLVMKLYYDNDWVDMFLYYLNPATNNLDWATGGLSQSNNPQSFQYLVQNTGTYYLMLMSELSQSQNHYTISLKTETSQQFVSSGFLMNIDMPLTQILNNASSKSLHAFYCKSLSKIRIQYNGPPSYKIHLFQPGTDIFSSTPIISNISDLSSKEIVLELSSQQGEWKIVIQHNVTKVIQRTEYTISLQVDQQSKQVIQCIGLSCANYEIQKRFPLTINLDCSKVEYSTGEFVQGKTDQCVCMEPRLFETNTLTCELDYSEVQNSASPEIGSLTSIFFHMIKFFAKTLYNMQTLLDVIRLTI